MAKFGTGAARSARVDVRDLGPGSTGRPCRDEPGPVGSTIVMVTRGGHERPGRPAWHRARSTSTGGRRRHRTEGADRRASGCRRCAWRHRHELGCRRDGAIALAVAGAAPERSWSRRPGPAAGGIRTGRFDDRGDDGSEASERDQEPRRIRRAIPDRVGGGARRRPSGGPTVCGHAVPAHGRPAVDVLADLDRLRRRDVRWKEGRAFTLAYFAGDEVHDLAAEVYRLVHDRERAEHRRLPSAAHDAGRRRRHRERLARGRPGRGRVHDLGRHREHPARGEGRPRAGRAERGDRPTRTWCCPPRAHAAFEKAAYYFGVECTTGPGRARLAGRPRRDGGGDRRRTRCSSWRPRRSTPRASSTRSAEIAALAAARDINCHVDACMGGVIAPLSRAARASRSRRGTSPSTGSPRCRSISTSTATRARGRRC